MRRYIILLVLAISVCAVSCRKEPLDKVNPNNRVKACKTYLQQFLTVWEGMDQGYVFWDKDSIDWDARYDKYRPVFEAFDVPCLRHSMPVLPTILLRNVNMQRHGTAFSRACLTITL